MPPPKAFSSASIPIPLLKGFGIAEEAIARAPAAQINKTLADTMRNCVACHQTYRISVEAR